MDMKERLDAAIRKRDDLASQIQRLQGRREAALKSLQDVDNLIRARGIDPEKLDEVIGSLKLELETSLNEFEIKLKKTEAEMERYKGLS